MKSLLCFLILTKALLFSAQSSGTSPDKNSLLHQLLEGDSLVYYQCHVESAAQELRTASGHTLNSVAKSLSITEKFVLYRKDGKYVLSHFVSVLTMCPNRRFSGLKFKEKEYWEFCYKESKPLSDKALRSLGLMEEIGKEANEYDYAISTKNRNQLIILGGKKAKQLGLPENILISKLFKIQGE